MGFDKLFSALHTPHFFRNRCMIGSVGRVAEISVQHRAVECSHLCPAPSITQHNHACGIRTKNEWPQIWLAGSVFSLGLLAIILLMHC
jgi:hypothetical protein